jgi:hypothetical protein
MNLLLGFLPFLAFAVVDHVASTVIALSAAAVTAALLVTRQRSTGKAPKLLELGGLVLFGGMAILAVVTHASWSVLEVRLASDVGLFAIIAGSIVAGRPFTLAYAREQVPASVWPTARFVRNNLRLSAIWAAAFAALALADIGMIVGLPTFAGVIMSLSVLGGAAIFTMRARAPR